VETKPYSLKKKEQPFVSAKKKEEPFVSVKESFKNGKKQSGKYESEQC